jgi:ADP-ribose pyrophosphatase
MKKPKVIQRKIVYNGPRQTVYVDRLEVNNGNEIDYYIVNHRDAVAAIPITNDGKILLVEQYRHPVGRNLFDIPGGLIENGEDPKDSIKREILEETGYQASKVEFMCRFNTDPSMSPQEIILYKATNLIQVADASPEISSPIKVHLLEPQVIRDILFNRSENNLQFSSSWTMIGLLYYLNTLDNPKV